jgi:O-antigen ligase
MVCHDALRNMMSIGNIQRILLQAFLILVFFVYYQTRFVPGTLHSWVLLLSFVLTLPVIFERFTNNRATLPMDYVVLCVLGLLFLLGFAVHSTGAVIDSLQAYMLSLMCYIVVKENASMLSATFMLRLMKCFLLINGVFVILQFVTGTYYPAVLLAAGEPPLLIPSGVSDGPTKNGMLIAFALSFMLGRLLWGQRASFLDFLIFTVGVISLLLSASRAGTASFLVVVAAAVLFAVVTRKRFPLNLMNFAKAGLIFLIPLIVISVSDLGFDTLIWLRDPEADRYGVNAIIYKLTLAEDDSISERYQHVEQALRLMLDSPIQTLSVGFGLGSFIALHEGVNVHNSYFEVLFELGFYGFAAFVWLTVHVVRKVLSRENAIAMLPMLFALLSVMIFMAFHDVLRGRTFWIPLAILASYAYTAPRRQPSRKGYWRSLISVRRSSPALS